MLVRRSSVAARMSKADNLEKLRSVVPLSEDDWNALAKMPVSGEKNQLNHIQRIEWIVERLSKIYTTEQTKVWLNTENRILKGRRPIDLLKAGAITPVLSAVNSTVDGAYL